VGLARALTLLHGDRMNESVAREVLAVLATDPRPALTSEGLRHRLPLYDRRTVDGVLEALVAGVVLDFDTASASYRYHRDTALDFEVRRFVRHADGHEQHVRTNVDRFRQRYGRA
jgi:hypothetical protein